jgi:3-oxoacyl-[acyl-carrier-protein] synthase II
MGVISPLGNDLPTTWESCLAGRSGVGPITNFDATDYKTRIAAEVKGFDPGEHFAAKEIRRMDPVVQLALVATREAVADAGITFGGGLAERTGVIIGSGIGGMSTVAAQLQTLHERGPSKVSPFLIPMILPETCASMVAIEFGLKGPNLAVTSACATGSNAIGEAFEMIRRGAADVAVAGGSEKGVIPISVAGFSAMHAISERNDDPEHASRPFERDRDGFVVGEGAAILVLESLEHALARGARIHAELLGYGTNDDAYHIAAPEESGTGATACMLQAISSAGIRPEQVEYVNAHGTSTPLNDATETKAIKAAFGDHAYRLAISSTKSMTGHLLGAAGALEAAFCIRAMEDGVLPATMNLMNPDPECDLDYIPNQARQVQVSITLSNSFGFGGHNACLVLAKLGAR